MRLRPENAGLSGSVLIVAPLPPPIMGPSAITELMLADLRAAGVAVAHVDTRDERPIFNVGIFDIRNIALGLLHSGQLVLAARRPVDLVYISISQSRWGYVRDAVLLSIAKLFRRRIVVHFHGAQFQKFFGVSSRIERWMIRSTLSWVDTAIVLTERLRTNFDGLVAPERIRVLENGIPDPSAEDFEGIARRRDSGSPPGAGALQLLYVANDFGAKGAETAIRALAEPGLEQCELRMIGEPSPEDRRSALLLAERLQVTDRVVLLGPVEGEAKFDEFARADAFVYPTRYDAQPLVIIEAMALGLPIIASTHGGIPETVADAGLLVAESDHRAIADHVRRLIADPEERRRLGASARRRYLEHYTPERFNERLEALFAELLAPR